jgi:hypothetical protein
MTWITGFKGRGDLDRHQNPAVALAMLEEGSKRMTSQNLIGSAGRGEPKWNWL